MVPNSFIIRVRRTQKCDVKSQPPSACRVLSEKELVKLEGKRKKSEETLSKSDLDYYASCLKAERAR